MILYKLADEVQHSLLDSHVDPRIPAAWSTVLFILSYKAPNPKLGIASMAGLAVSLYFLKDSMHSQTLLERTVNKITLCRHSGVGITIFNL